MSEQYPSEAAPPEKENLPQPVSLTEMAEPKESRTRLNWIAPAWFFFGILVGIIGFAAYNALIAKPSTLVASTQPESVDSAAAMRTAAREGVLEAIATLNAGGPAAAQQPQGPQQVASNAFAVRETNRQGSPDAPVTVYEFSDFQ